MTQDLSDSVINVHLRQIASRLDGLDQGEASTALATIIPPPATLTSRSYDQPKAATDTF